MAQKKVGRDNIIAQENAANNEDNKTTASDLTVQEKIISREESCKGDMEKRG